MLKSLIVLIVQVNYAIIELPMATVVVLVNNQNSEYKALLGFFGRRTNTKISQDLGTIMPDICSTTKGQLNW